MGWYTFQYLGYCCIQYRKCDTKRSFTLGNQVGAFNQAKHGSDCAGDYIIIEGSSFILFSVASRAINFSNVLILNLIYLVLKHILGSSGTGSSLDELQNRYCGGILSPTTNAEADDSIIGKS